MHVRVSILVFICWDFSRAAASRFAKNICCQVFFLLILIQSIRLTSTIKNSLQVQLPNFEQTITCTLSLNISTKALLKLRRKRSQSTRNVD